MELKVNKIYRVKKVMNEMFDAKWITKGDIVRCIGIYPHHILVEKLKPGKNGWRMRQCYCKNGIEKDLEVV